MAPNLVVACRACNLAVEDHPELADRASGIVGWRLVVHDGDPEWESLGRRNDRTGGASASRALRLGL